MKNALIAMLALVLAVGLAVPMAGPASAAQPAFEATIDITSATGDFQVEVGQALDLTATWSTNRDVTRESWSVDGAVSQGPTNIDASSGVSHFTFDSAGLTVGQNYNVCFRIWHHTQSDRDATQCVTIEVVETTYEWETAFAYGDGDANCFLDCGFSRWGWTNGPLGEGEYTFELWAAAGQCDTSKGILVGSVDVTYAAGSVEVTFNVDAPYVLDETHVYAGSDMFPLDNKDDPTVAPGQYYIGDGLSGEIYVIVHAVVGIPM